MKKDINGWFVIVEDENSFMGIVHLWPDESIDGIGYYDTCHEEWRDIRNEKLDFIPTHYKYLDSGKPPNE